MRIAEGNFENCDNFHGRESPWENETDGLNTFGERKTLPTTGFCVILSRIREMVFWKVVSARRDLYLEEQPCKTVMEGWECLHLREVGFKSPSC
jgi:hypothetical protein